MTGSSVQPTSIADPSVGGSTITKKHSFPMPQKTKCKIFSEKAIESFNAKYAITLKSRREATTITPGFNPGLPGLADTPMTRRHRP